jgi:alpha-L-rhamnosidase
MIPGPLSFKPLIYPQFFYYQALKMQTAYAERMGIPADVARYSAAAKAAGAVLLARLYNSTTACFGNCTDVEQIMGLSTGLLAEGSVAERAAWANAVSWFDASAKTPERFGGGIVSLQLLYPLLERFGLSDLGLRFQLHTDAPPSFGYWMAQNATTLWEDWTNSATQADSGLNSYNHIMFGSTGSW